ncbi:protein bicaudal D homolog 2-like isoform X4 [Acanthaster planci]|uniref:Protein bicaudal D homolog 2-like isoform X4 n=1 Tax=Acanthaster planci TaxID=133434 RepID=A0A8B7ZIA9_ACAPL|nr:protein bicaudal D homolog 2-like isoform X4 [Acanthaster planci]
MSDSDEFPETIDELRVEIERLKDELNLASQEKIQAAEYGLVVLEEKQALKQQFEELEVLYETSKTELQLAKEALDQHQLNQKKHTLQEVNREENLLKETATREADLVERISDLESENKSYRQELTHIKIENERLHARHGELVVQTEKLEVVRKTLKDEVRDIKFRETRLLQDYSELEEENIAMQKQISMLKSSVVEYEAMKHENRRLTEETQYLNTHIEDLIRLREIADKQIEETLQALEAEREQKHYLKKQLDQAMIMEMEAFNNDLMNSSGLLGEDADSDTESQSPDHPILRRMEYEFQSTNGTNGLHMHGQSTCMGSDLYSEMQSTEVQKLEEQLAKLQTEKTELSQNLEQTIGALNRLPDDLNISGTDSEGEPLPEDLSVHHRKLLNLVRLVKHHEKKYATAMSQITALQAKVDNQQDKLNEESKKPDLQSEVDLLNDRNRHQEMTIKSLQTQMRQMNDIIMESQGHLNCTQDELINVSEDLAQLYHHVCVVNGETPNRVILDHLKATRQSRRESFRAEIASRLKEVSFDADMSREKPVNLNASENDGNISTDESSSPASSIKSSTPISSPSRRIPDASPRMVGSDPITCNNLLTTIRDQIKYLKRSVEHAVEMSRQRSNETAGSAETEDLREEVMKQKALLATKRDQIVTLRTVLKANKTTAEVALANLKSKYENEKTIIAETMIKLRNELKALKEDAATFASLRAMFATRCDEYVTQLDEMQRQLASAEEEKKTLNSLLRMAIQQKLALTQRLEDLECHTELQQINPRKAAPRRHKPSKVASVFSKLTDTKQKLPSQQHSRHAKRVWVPVPAIQSIQVCTSLQDSYQSLESFPPPHSVNHSH